MFLVLKAFQQACSGRISLKKDAVNNDIEKFVGCASVQNVSCEVVCKARQVAESIWSKKSQKLHLLTTPLMQLVSHGIAHNTVYTAGDGKNGKSLIGSVIGLEPFCKLLANQIIDDDTFCTTSAHFMKVVHYGEMKNFDQIVDSIVGLVDGEYDRLEIALTRGPSAFGLLDPFEALVVKDYMVHGQWKSESGKEELVADTGAVVEGKVPLARSRIFMMVAASLIVLEKIIFMVFGLDMISNQWTNASLSKKSAFVDHLKTQYTNLQKENQAKVSDALPPLTKLMIMPKIDGKFGLERANELFIICPAWNKVLFGSNKIEPNTKLDAPTGCLPFLGPRIRLQYQSNFKATQTAVNSLLDKASVSKKVASSISGSMFSTARGSSTIHGKLSPNEMIQLIAKK